MSGAAAAGFSALKNPQGKFFSEIPFCALSSEVTLGAAASYSSTRCFHFTEKRTQRPFKFLCVSTPSRSTCLTHKIFQIGGSLGAYKNLLKLGCIKLELVSFLCQLKNFIPSDFRLKTNFEKDRLCFFFNDIYLQMKR